VFVSVSMTCTLSVATKSWVSFSCWVGAVEDEFELVRVERDECVDRATDLGHAGCCFDAAVAAAERSRMRRPSPAVVMVNGERLPPLDADTPALPGRVLGHGNRQGPVGWFARSTAAWHAENRRAPGRSVRWVRPHKLRASGRTEPRDNSGDDVGGSTAVR
jgi:hypothetical protein